MRTFVALSLAALTISGCSGFSRDRDTGLCSELLTAKLNKSSNGTETRRRLEDANIMCLVSVIDNTMTARPVPAARGNAGKLIPVDDTVAAILSPLVVPTDPVTALPVLVTPARPGPIVWVRREPTPVWQRLGGGGGGGGGSDGSWN